MATNVVITVVQHKGYLNDSNTLWFQQIKEELEQLDSGCDSIRLYLSSMMIALTGVVAI